MNPSQLWMIRGNEETCRRKIGYVDRGAAKRAMSRISGRRRTQHGRLKVYRCPHCRMFHVGTKVTRKMKAQRDQDVARAAQK